MSKQLRSPLPWVGGKYYSAERIVAAFPPPGSYQIYCDLFGGAAHILLAKPIDRHREVFNDVSEDLINFWLQVRDNQEALYQRCQSLPYSRALYYRYHASLFNGEVLDPLERAVRWFYVLRNNFTGNPPRRTPAGWNNAKAHAYRSALELFAALAQRFRYVHLDNRDFERVFTIYDSPQTFIYVDPPYIKAEFYYGTAFQQEDHERLARLLNNAQSQIALSYYPHALLDELYPADRWRRMTWTAVKYSQRSMKKRERTVEMLLMNYPEPAPSKQLWDESAVPATLPASTADLG